MVACDGISSADSFNCGFMVIGDRAEEHIHFVVVTGIFKVYFLLHKVSLVH